MSNAPRYEIDVSAFWADPYPDLAKMRKQVPIRTRDAGRGQAQEVSAIFR
jgi:hypothetical protein